MTLGIFLVRKYHIFVNIACIFLRILLISSAIVSTHQHDKYRKMIRKTNHFNSDFVITNSKVLSGTFMLDSDLVDVDKYCSINHISTI